MGQLLKVRSRLICQKMKCKSKLPSNNIYNVTFFFNFNKKIVSHFLPSLAQCVKGMLAFAIFITHAIACYVAIDLTWNNYVVEKIGDGRRKLLWEYTVRTLIVLATCK